MRALFRWLNDFYQIYKQHKANAKLSRRIDLIVKDQNRVYDYLKKRIF